MPHVNKYGYLQVRGSKKIAWIVSSTKYDCGVIQIGKAFFSKDMIGRRVRFKVEVV